MQGFAPVIQKRVGALCVAHLSLALGWFYYLLVCRFLLLKRMF